MSPSRARSADDSALRRSLVYPEPGCWHYCVPGASQRAGTTPLSMPLFTNGVMSQATCVQGHHASGVSCPLRRAALI